MLTCAIIDDERSVHRLIRNIIKKDGLPLIVTGSAFDGQEGKKLIESKDFDIIFIDVQMPLLDGFELIERYPNNKYIVVTAFDYFDYAQKALRLGVKDILLKPIDRVQFDQAVIRALGFKLTKNEIIDEILIYINQKYRDEIHVGDLAEKYYMTSSNLSRLFKECVGETVSDYIKKTRINKAKGLLMTSHKSISEISEDVGYKSENLFYKDFKKIEGLTPANYRKENI